MTSHLDRRGLVWGGVGVAILLAITLFGSGGLVWFDAALVVIDTLLEIIAATAPDRR